MKAKWLSFASVYFFESSLFNGLRPIQIKKSDPRLKLCAKRLIRPCAACLRPIALSFSLMGCLATQGSIRRIEKL